MGFRNKNYFRRLNEDEHREGVQWWQILFKDLGVPLVSADLFFWKNQPKQRKTKPKKKNLKIDKYPLI